MAQLNQPTFGYTVVLQSHSELTAHMNQTLQSPSKMRKWHFKVGQTP